MHGNDFVTSSRRHFTDYTPTVDAEYCLNRRHKAAACTRCAAACPVQAITVADGTPALDTAQCVSCGVCEAACPTDVFTEPRRSEEKLVQAVSQASATVALVCPVKSAPGLTAAPVAVVVRHKRCLAALDVADLLAMTQSGTRTVWLDDNSCSTCPLAAAQQTLHASVISAQTLLQAVDGSARLQLCSDHPELAATEAMPRPVLDGMQPQISRRQLFSFAERATPSPRQIDSVPLSHRRVLAQLRRMASKDEAHLAETLVPFADVQIDEQACSACALCAYFCPTAALRFEVAVQEFVIYFQADRCIDCNLCQIACPEDAIQLGDAIFLARLFAQDEQALITGDLAHCTQCGADTAVSDGEQLCHACRHGAGLVTSLRDDAGLMADLLSRIAPLPPTISI